MILFPILEVVDPGIPWPKLRLLMVSTTLASAGALELDELGVPVKTAHSARRIGGPASRRTASPRSAPSSSWEARGRLRPQSRKTQCVSPLCSGAR